MCITSHLPVSDFIFIILSNYLVLLSLAGVPCGTYWTENLGSLNNITPIFTTSYKWLINIFNNKNLFWFRSPGHSALSFILHPQLDLTLTLSGLFPDLFSPWLQGQSFLIRCMEGNLSKCLYGSKKLLCIPGSVVIKT